MNASAARSFKNSGARNCAHRCVDAHPWPKPEWVEIAAELRQMDEPRRTCAARLVNSHVAPAAYPGNGGPFIPVCPSQIRHVGFWHVSEAPHRWAKVCLLERFGRACERARLPPMTPKQPFPRLSSTSRTLVWNHGRDRHGVRSANPHQGAGRISTWVNSPPKLCHPFVRSYPCSQRQTIASRAPEAFRQDKR